MRFYNPRKRFTTIELPKGASKLTEKEITMNMTELEKLFIGFDRLNHWPLKAPTTEYPRYNIVKIEDGYQIQVAVPGWNKKQVSISFSEDTKTLTISGQKKEVENKDAWVHKGISGKSFERVFKLDSNLEVFDADMADGMLVVNIKRSKNSGVKTIPIGQAPEKLETA